MRLLQASLLTSFVLLSACGGGGGGNHATGNTPRTYTLYLAQPGSMPADGEFEAGPFTLPVAGVVDYTITNRSPTTPDFWDISVISSSELPFFEAGQQYSGFAPHASVSTQSDSAAVPAGTYTIGILCRNIFEDCEFSLDATMTY